MINPSAPSVPGEPVEGNLAFRPRPIPNQGARPKTEHMPRQSAHIRPETEHIGPKTEHIGPKTEHIGPTD